MVAIDKIISAQKTELLDSCDVYVNVEPCIMCAAALMKLRVRSIYYGCANDKFGGDTLYVIIICNKINNLL